MSKAAKIWVSLFIVVLGLGIVSQIRCLTGDTVVVEKAPAAQTSPSVQMTSDRAVQQVHPQPVKVDYEQLHSDGVLCRQMFFDTTGKAVVSASREDREMTFNLGSTNAFTEGLGLVTATDTFVSGCESERYRTYPVEDIPIEPALGCPVEVDNNNQWTEVGVRRNALSVIIRITMGDVQSIFVSAEPGGYAEYSRFGNPSRSLFVSVDCKGMRQ